MLKFEPWSKQAELLTAPLSHRYIACRSGHKCGKTTALAALALWFLCTKPRSRVVITAPAAHQIQNAFWGEVRRLYELAQKHGTALGGQLNATAYSGLHFADGRDMVGIATDKPERFNGLSAPNFLLLVDEASGVDEKIYQSIFGNAASDAWVVLISNPTRTGGTFFDAFHSKRDNWHRIHISSLDNPNFHGADVPGLAKPGWVEKMKVQWGEWSPYFDVRIRGEFPTQAENSVIPLALVDAAQARWRDATERPDPADALSLGVDVARYGDDETVIATGRGLRLYPLVALRNQDGPQVAARVLREARDLARLGEIPECAVDVIGVGASVYDSLALHSQHLYTRPINVAVKSHAPDMYADLRTQLWFQVRDWLRAGGTLPDDDALAAELVAATYQLDRHGRYAVDSKDRIKELLSRSPDRADAVCLYAHAAARGQRWSGLPTGAAAGLSLADLRRLLPKRRMSEQDAEADD